MRTFFAALTVIFTILFFISAAVCVVSFGVMLVASVWDSANVYAISGKISATALVSTVVNLIAATVFMKFEETCNHV